LELETFANELIEATHDVMVLLRIRKLLLAMLVFPEMKLSIAPEEYKPTTRETAPPYELPVLAKKETIRQLQFEIVLFKMKTCMLLTVTAPND
jgi:hypothetical protein